MSNQIARKPRSYLNEELLLEQLPIVMLDQGFVQAIIRKNGAMKFVDAVNQNGESVTFWIKQGWTDSPAYSAIQFGLFARRQGGSIPNDEFLDVVRARSESAKDQGANYALIVRMIDGEIKSWVALTTENVYSAYEEQLANWPDRARNSKSPTLWFFDSRSIPQSDCISSVTKREISLLDISGKQGETASRSTAIGSKKVTAELEIRLRQSVFRRRVGEKFGWRCAVTGTNIREILDAAHLIGRDWRINNEADDGVLIRADLHRMLDKGLAEIIEDKFLIKESIRNSEYAAFHGVSITGKVDLKL